MKKKPMLLKSIKQEELEKKAKEIALIKEKKSESKRIEELEKAEINVQDKANEIKKNQPIQKINIIKETLKFIIKLITLFTNLIISIFESFQWIFMSIVVTVAVLIILNVYDVNTNDIFVKIISILSKQ